MFQWISAAPRRTLALVCAACVAMLAFALYLQHVVGLEPCPMCIVQRYALILVGVSAGVGAAIPRRGAWIGASAFGLLFAGFGGFVAARQSWLQWFPPEIVSCGRDFYGMIETFPLKRAVPMIFRGSGDCTKIDWTFPHKGPVPMIFRGSGDCTKIDWTFLGGSIANWSFVAFVVFALVFLGVLTGLLRRPRSAFA